MHFLAKLKRYLSEIDASTWHYRITESVWGERRLRRGKACTYYWFRLPLAILAAILVFAVIIPSGAVVGYFLGFRIRLKDDGSKELFCRYKRNSRGQRVLFAPWEASMVGAAIVAIYYLAFLNHGLGVLILMIALGIAALALVLGTILYSWNHPIARRARWSIADAWDQVCPNLVIRDR